MNRKLLIFIIIPMHLFLLCSIFDIYFTSPIISEISTVPVLHNPLANRLVLYVVDGLRADKIFYNNMDVTPYIKNIIIDGNSWGISNTRVPTETRPGHVALIAGFYEDVSSITKGWQENAVEFDSLFNRSSHTWSWGSPDVLPMFQKGAIKDKIKIFCYPPEYEDFAGNNTWKLDTWVFDQVKKFFSEIVPNSEEDKSLRRKGVVFFLHLLGMDVNGHSQKPHSQLYTKNLKIVSEGIENITNLIDGFYRDNRTAYIITSDHGMTDWGSHGAGSVHETATPVITWGSGFYNHKLSDNKLTKSLQHTSLLSLKMNETLYKSRRTDIWQADLCALMASILGIHIPINSVGVVPIEYIDADESVKSKILKNNIMQIFTQFQAKYEQKKRNRFIFFQDYSILSQQKASEDIERGSNYITNGQYRNAIYLFQNLFPELLGGIMYYHTYDRVWLGFLISLSFISWILLLATHVVHIPVLEERPCKLWNVIVLALLILFYSLYVIAEQQPLSYLIYKIIPTVILWTIFVFKRSHVKYLISLSKENYWFIIGVSLLVESIVWSFFYRQVLLVGLLVTFFFIFLTTFKFIGIKLKLKWTLSCALLMIYPNLPVISGHNSPSLVFFGGILICLHSLFVFCSNKSSLSFSNGCVLKIILVLLNIFTIYHVYNLQITAQSGNHLTLLSKCLSWIIFLSVLPIVTLTRCNLKDRYAYLFTSLGIMYNLTSIYYELLFFHSLIFFSMTLKEVEIVYRMENLSLSLIDKRKIIHTIIYVFLLTYSFFATGNIASINSFDVASTYCFVTMFRPFVMGFILIVKLMIPMVVISLVYLYIQLEHTKSIKFSPHGYIHMPKINTEDICLVTIISDFAALHFLFMIKDQGSWLEIGTSISHYVITMAISICSVLFALLAQFLLTFKSSFYECHEMKVK